jgi:iron-sulfur cluster assembly protein
VLEYLKEDKFDPADERIVYKDFVVKVPTKDVVYLKGLVVDYVKNGLNEGFEFRNPNERDRCGCGESFRV